MTKLNPNHLIWAIAVVLTVGVPGSIATWNLTRPTVGPVDPTPAPTPVVAYADLVREACKDLTGDERSYVASQYAATRAVTLCERQPADAVEYQKLLESVREDYYGTAYPHAERVKPVWDVAIAEAEKRGILEGAWDREKWRAFADDTLMGVLP